MRRRNRRDADLRQRVSRICRRCRSLECLAPSAGCRNRLTPALRPSRLGGRDRTVELFRQGRKIKEFARFLPNPANTTVEGLDGAPVSRVEVQ